MARFKLMERVWDEENQMIKAVIFNEVDDFHEAVTLFQDVAEIKRAQGKSFTGSIYDTQTNTKLTVK